MLQTNEYSGRFTSNNYGITEVPPQDLSGETEEICDKNHSKDNWYWGQDLN
jgi:hypothetical protein